MPYVDASGIRLYFEEQGDGYPIIFIHELGSDLRQWEDQVRYFSRAYRWIAYNARGYPPSDLPEDTAAYGWERSVDDVAAVMEGLGVDRAHVVGLSMGAYAALQFGSRYPSRVSAIVSAAAGSGSVPTQRGAWSRETSILARGFERDPDAIAEKMANSATRRGYPTNDYSARGRTSELRLLTNSSIEVGEGADAKVIPLYQEQSPL
jgi:pimeloyl-ACP methyl ester carboxylesterase